MNKHSIFKIKIAREKELNNNKLEGVNLTNETDMIHQ